MFLIFFAIVGAVMGSFACCQAWRWHRKVEKKKMPARSVCMKCGKKLEWWENIPVISWCAQKGKCRGCGKKIGAAEILMEVLGAASFAGLYLSLGLTPRLACVLILVVILGILAVYDGKWGELPTVLLILAVVVAGLSWLTMEVNVASGLVAVGILAGIYFVLGLVSRGKLVGDGDWLLALAVALALANWWLAIIVMAISNLLAVVYAIFVQKRKIYFGPFIVAAFIITLCLEEVLCSLCLI